MERDREREKERGQTTDKKERQSENIKHKERERFRNIKIERERGRKESYVNISLLTASCIQISCLIFGSISPHGVYCVPSSLANALDIRRPENLNVYILPLFLCLSHSLPFLLISLNFIKYFSYFFFLFTIPSLIIFPVYFFRLFGLFSYIRW